MGQLISSGGDGGGLEHCGSCGALAAGPCARCHKPLCGDCCVIVKHGASPWAVCRSCSKRQGDSLRHAWIALLTWMVVPLVFLAALVAGISFWIRSR